MTEQSFRVRKGLTVANATNSANLSPIDLLIGSLVANGSGVYAPTVNASSFTATGFVGNASGLYHTGTVNAATVSVGTFTTANATVINAASINARNQINTDTFYAATTANVGALQINTTAIATGTTLINATSINSAAIYVGGVAVITTSGTGGFQTTAGLAANVATLTANNSTNFAGQPQSYYANLSTATFTVQAAVGANVIANTTTIRVGNSTVNAVHANDQIYVGNSTANAIQNTLGFSVGLIDASHVGINISNTSITIGNSSINAIINSTTFNATANNATNLAGAAASAYQTIAGLSANVATLTANNATNLGGVAASSYLTKATADQVITGGGTVTELDLGTISSGTVTPDPGDRPMQIYTNNGAHTLAPGANSGTYYVTITNGATPGAITTSGWTKVVGTFTTTVGNKFRCGASIGGGGVTSTSSGDAIMLLTPLPFMGVSTPAEVSWTDEGGKTTPGGTTHSYTSMSFGATDTRDRYIMLTAWYAGPNTPNFVSATIGGVAVTPILTGDRAFIAIALVPTGTTGTVSMTWNGSNTGNAGCSLYRLIGINPTPWTVVTDNSLTSNHYDVTVDVPAGGVVIGRSENNDDNQAFSYTWTGLTEAFDVLVGTWDRHSGALLATNTAVSALAIRAQLSGSPDNGGALDVIVFGSDSPPPPTSIAYRANTASTSSTISIPSGTVTGDLMVFLDFCANTTVPPDVTPSGWTGIFMVTTPVASSNFARIRASYKIATNSDIGTTVAGLVGSSSYRYKQILSISGDHPITSVALSSLGSEVTAGNPVAQVVSSSGGQVPLVVICCYTSWFNISPRTFTPTKDGEVSSDNFAYLAWKIYNSASADVTVDMDQEGTWQSLQSFYVECH